jgi:hypothetical protein
MRKEIEDAIKRPCMIMDEKIMDIAPRAPQGTVLFLLEQMHKVPTALLQNFYESFAQELDLLNDRLEDWFPAGQPYPFAVAGGDHFIMKEDFSPSVKVYPAVDPSLPNSSYRMLQAELLLQTASQYPALINPKPVLINYLESMGVNQETIQAYVIPDPSPPPPVQPLDPVTENGHLLTSVPVNSGIDQDHDAHIIVHSQLLTHPDPSVAAAAQAHIKQHEAMKFTVQIYSQLNMPIPADPSQLPPQQQNQIALMAAHLLQQQSAQKQGHAGPTPEQIQMAQIEAQNQKSEREAQLKAAEIQLEYERLRQDSVEGSAVLAEKESANRLRLQLEQLKFEHEKELKAVELRMKMQEMNWKQMDEARKQDKHIIELTTVNHPKEKTHE